MPRAVAGRFPPEQQFKLTFQGPEITDALVNLGEMLAGQLTDARAWRRAVACELYEFLYILEAHAEALCPADET
ncbi:MAG TPA: hypothetical protein VKT99_04920 [Xanthobacteraceae bacterium]|nr:hypothetical protein [Xanthobacteraceae bacterium]